MSSSSVAYKNPPHETDPPAVPKLFKLVAVMAKYCELAASKLALATPTTLFTVSLTTPPKSTKSHKHPGAGQPTVPPLAGAATPQSLLCRVSPVPSSAL